MRPPSEAMAATAQGRSASEDMAQSRAEVQAVPSASRSDEGVAFFREPMFKRPFDLLLSGAGLLLSLPLWALFALLIWLEDGRPIFFRQRRIGRNGRLFTTLKFRSMIKDPGQVERQATKDDQRITQIGRVLRKTALDELSQIWNIFLGDMSFVGPRSQPEKELVRVGNVEKELYIREVPGYGLRQQVRPGLTGVAQIFAPREVPHRYKFKYDLIYIRRIMRSKGFLGGIRMFFYDLGLILRSIWTTVRGRWEV